MSTTKEKTRTSERTKLGLLLDERGYTLKDFAVEVYEKTGYLIAVTNLSNYCTGVKRVKNVDIARHFAETLGVSIIDVL
jgi:hypothetical protein